MERARYDWTNHYQQRINCTDIECEISTQNRNFSNIMRTSILVPFLSSTAHDTVDLMEGNIVRRIKAGDDGLNELPPSKLSHKKEVSIECLVWVGYTTVPPPGR